MSETSAVSAPQDARSRALATARSAYAALLQRLGVTPELSRYALLVFALSRAGFIVVTLLATRFLHAFRPGTGTFIGTWGRYDAIS
ncbi:MAG TPA: hypothetical protein VGS80_07925 [Ktedonobacterales bacterium]|jgi:hypothetical protein|nr:hypothetical protein [Ktedonobacterales bacterium]